MLVQNLAITYKCFSSIGTSLNLKEMMDKTLKTFVSETYAIFAQYAIEDENQKYSKLSQFGKVDNFDPNNYTRNFDENIKLLTEKNRKILILKLDYGFMFLITKNLEADCSFFVSMFESFMQKLNASIQACLNVQKMEDANKLLVKQKKELEIANKAKDDFLANMSHELKTPLNSINIISSVMKENKEANLNEKQVKNLSIVNNCGKYLLTLINDVLDISKLESGKVTVDYKKMNLIDTLNEIYDMFLPQTKEKGLNIDFEFDKSLNFIYSDKNKIKQVVKNLLSNALKFTKEGTIKLKAIDEDDYVCIVVEDQGIGIEENKLLNIFDRFKQADDSTTRKYGGTGLGLSISKEILELLKGSIYAKSRPDKGSKFYATIPKNLHHLESLDFLDIKEEDKNFDDENNIIDIKKKILFLNTNAVEFFKTVVHLQGEFDLTQVLDLEELLEQKNKDFEMVIVYEDSLDTNTLKSISSYFKKKLVVLSSDKNTKTIENIKYINKNLGIKQLIQRLKDGK